MTKFSLPSWHRENSLNNSELLYSAINNYETDDMQLAITQFLALSAQDCEEAFLYLSLIYREGDGTAKDEVAAIRYKKQYAHSIELKAVAGIPGYRLKLAYLLQYGDGAPVDTARAFSIFLTLAEEGCGEAQFHLSRIYARGECGKHPDAAMELHWLDRATRVEWPMAIYYSALLLEGNSDAVDSIHRVKEMMNKASQLGCWQATEYLASNP